MNKNLLFSPPSDKKLNNNYFSEKNETIKKNKCTCYTFYDETLIRNNLCRLCGRYTENHGNNYNSNPNNQNSYVDNILKKKNIETDNFKPR